VSNANNPCLKNVALVLSSTNAIYQTTGFSADNKENLGAFPLSAKASPSTSKVDHRDLTNRHLF
jgi:hypothetical protein